MKVSKISQKVQERIVLVGLFGLLGVLLVLMCLMGKYSFRQVDDYSYAYVEDVWISTHSVWKTLVGEIHYSIETWRDWQGLYFGDWLFFVLLAIFGRDGYFITVYLAAIPFVVVQLYGCRVLFHDILGGTRTQSYIIGIPVILLQLMFPPSAAEGFYWLCGSVLYTMTYALELLMIASLLRLLFVEKRTKRIWLRCLIIFLGFALAGSNYISALGIFCIYGILVLYTWVCKSHEKLFMTVGYLWFIGWFLLNVLSPGASARQNAAGEGMGAVEAVLISFREAWRYLTNWWILPVTLIMIALVPVLLRVVMAGKMQYRMPLLFSVLSFCVYAAQFTPCLYAVGQIGAYRVQNLYRFSLYIMLVLNEWYWIGYLHSVRQGKMTEALNTLFGRIPLGTVLFALLAVIVIAPIMCFRYGDTVTAISAYRSLRSGQAARYYQENLDRMACMESEEEDVVLAPFSSAPYLLFFGDLQEDPESWENVAYANYYGKKSVRIQE